MTDSRNDGLDALARRCGLRIGTCLSVHPLRDDPHYSEAAAREFGVVTPENAMKFATLCPSRYRYDFEGADRIVEFAETNGLAVRGHVLVWYLQLPKWLSDGDFDSAELTEVLTGHIAMVVGRYAGRVAVWDVVNEAIAEDGSFRQSIWYRTIGRNYVDIAFHAARDADPAATLYYNDYGIEGSDRHAEGVYRLVRGLLERGVPVDGVGLQMHLDIDQADRVDSLLPNLQRLNALGLRTQVTELDVRMKVNGRPTAEQASRQAEIYRRVLRSCLQAPGCEALVVWGVTDRYSWIPHFYTGEGAALVLDESYGKKAGYFALQDELRGTARVASYGG